MNKLPENLIKLPELSEWSILLGYRGSIIHNTFRPNSEPNSIDDIDLMSIVIPPTEYYYGLEEFGSRSTKEIKQDEWDIVCYEVKKFVKLLMVGNPNVVSMRWLNPEHYLKVTPSGKLLIDNRELFFSQKIYHSFLGYSKDQLYKTEHLACKGYMGEKRKKLVEKFGYDTKNASHLIRLMTMCNEWLEQKKFNVFRQDANFYVNIKNGGYSLDNIKLMANDLFSEGEILFNKYKNDFPEEVDKKKVNELLLEVFKTNQEYE